MKGKIKMEIRQIETKYYVIAFLLTCVIAYVGLETSTGPVYYLGMVLMVVVWSLFSYKTIMDFIDSREKKS